jgi:hypothetical protein
MFNLEEYTTVKERIDEFWKKYPNGRISTEILEWSDKRFIVAAAIYREITDPFPFSTGLANEVISDRGVNKDFALENGATSAIGIACSNAGIGVEKHRMSREEANKVVATKVAKPAVAEVKADDQDYWTTPVNEYMKVVDAPITLDKAMENVASIIGTAEAAEVPSCKHGSRIWKTGRSAKTGKEWGGYSCSLSGHAGTEGNCEMEWYEINSAGKWQPQKKWA